ERYRGLVAVVVKDELVTNLIRRDLRPAEGFFGGRIFRHVGYREDERSGGRIPHGFLIGKPRRPAAYCYIRVGRGCRTQARSVNVSIPSVLIDYAIRFYIWPRCIHFAPTVPFLKKSNRSHRFPTT